MIELPELKENESREDYTKRVLDLLIEHHPVRLILREIAKKFINE